MLGQVKPIKIKEEELLEIKDGKVVPGQELKPLTDREQAEKELYDSYNEDDYDEVIDIG